MGLEEDWEAKAVCGFVMSPRRHLKRFLFQNELSTLADMTASDPTPLILTAAQTGRAALQEAEWLLTNGTGSFAMGTALGCNTRRYHGLLVAAATPPVGRVVVLNQVADELILHGTQGQADQKSP